MERTTIYSWRLGIVAILVAAVALVTVMSACSNTDDSEAMSAMNASISSQNAEIEALAAQVSDLQSELATVTAASSAASSETAALQAAIDGMKMEMNDDDDEPAEDYSDDIRSLESDISDLSEMIAENTDSIDALPNAMSAIASTILSEHADEHDGLEAAIQKAFDEHGVAHGQLEDAIEESVIDLMADIAEGKEEEGETAGLLERFDWLEQAVAPAITQAYVDEAIRYYQANGRQATIDYYNSMESVKDDLYLFVLDEDYKIRVQPVVPANIGMDIRGPLGTDITGKNYGPEFVTVDERGKWVDYVYLNPADGFGYERKHTWTVRHDGLIFASGWYERDVALDKNPAAYTRALVHQAVARYDGNGRDATIDYYNSPESVDGQYYVFIGDENDMMIAHAPVPANVGKHFNDVISPDGYPAGAQVAAAAVEGGAWTTYTYLNASTGNVETKHSWVTRHNGMIFGSGWYEEGPPKSDAAAYTKAFVDRAVNLYNDLGREGTVAYYNSPDSVDGQWYVFIGDENDVMLAHATIPANVGKHFNDVISPDGYPAGAQVAAAAVEGGAWTTYTYLNAVTGNVETKHSWVTRHNGMIFGSGWYEEGPSKSDAAAYAQSLVQRAVNLYDDLGRDGTVDYYNKPESVDGPWYVFILRENDLRTLANGARPELVDIDPPARIDAAGYAYGEAFAATTDEGHWVSYVFINPATDEFESKHTWIMEHDGLLFGSGWYAEPAAYTQYLVNEAISMYESEGREATVAYYNSPDSIDGQWYVFIGDENDVMLAHAPVPENVGKHFDEIISPDGYPAGAQAAAAAVEGGAWTTYTYLNAVSGNAETKHSWMVRHDGLIFGSGWYEEGPAKSDAAAYAQSLVQRATHLYDDLGREAAITYYNSPESLDGEWYTFVLDAGDFRSLANAARPELVGNIPERIDVTGYNYGAEFATVTEDGKWVSYVFKNPAKNDELAQKSTWLVKRGDLIFGAGYYEQ